MDTLYRAPIIRTAASPRDDSQARPVVYSNVIAPQILRANAGTVRVSNFAHENDH